MRAQPPARRRAVVCDVARVDPDATTVDALARLQLAARRRGFEIVLSGVSDDLRRLIELIGLADVLPDAATTRAGVAGRTGGRSSRC